MTLDISINGAQISYVEIQNKVDLGEGLFEYSVKVYDDENLKGTIVHVQHNRDESYLVLLKKVFEELCENYS